jgi:3-oxoacyl-[acyl-carrier protein] reductase
MSVEAKPIEPRIAVVTGGSRGIGRAIVEQLARAGIEVRFTYLRDERAATSVVDGLQAEGHAVRTARVDSRDAAALSSFVEGVIAEDHRLDVLINNAGVTADRLLHVMSEEEWLVVLDTSLKGLFGATRIAARQMMRQRAGRIVSLTSVSGMHGIAGQTNYAAAKAAIIGFTRALARELGPWSVCVNAVAPGYVETDMLDSLTPAQRKAALERVPLRRFASPDEIAQLVVYMALHAPSFLTGQTIAIDGGMTA